MDLTIAVDIESIWYQYQISCIEIEDSNFIFLELADCIDLFLPLLGCINTLNCYNKITQVIPNIHRNKHNIFR